MMLCANRCRACNACAFLEKQHVCEDRSELFASLKSLGANTEGLCLPDCGKGRVVWETEYHLRWADPSRSFFGVRDSEAIVDLLDSTEDPLNNSDVVFLKL
jgi:hypothetical protein